jgi:hypothetical protein
MSLVDMVAKGYSDNGYSNEVFFTEDGDWFNEDCQCEDFDDEYFGYADEEDYGGASELIEFEIEPTLTEDSYGFQLTEDSLDYTESVEAYIYMVIEGAAVELGETDDVIADWDKGIFVDNFDGRWLSLPNYRLLATYIADTTDEYTVYTSPILLNGKRTNLRIRQYNDYTLVVEGAWDGIDENGSASREIKQIKEGDKIAPLYYLEDGSSFDMDEYTWEAGDEIIYGYLYPAEYEYCFCINDIYGDSYITDYVVFEIDNDGNISFAS